MSDKNKGYELIPSAKRLIKSLRDMGYDFVQAVADIVDNSVTARASIINIDLEFDGDNSWVRIMDNGRGMDRDTLLEAMRYGSERKYEEDDLGKFGLGLKTASMSQCQCLSVASRCSKTRANIAAFAWDLDHIEKTNRWEILPLERNGLSPAIRNELKDNTGTIVLWQRLDRFLGYKHPYGEMARKQLISMCRDLELHLGMVFEKFLSGAERKKSLKIFLNNNEIKPWDPFCRSEKKTRKLQLIKLNVDNEGVVGEVQIQPYILPHQDDFSSREAWELAGGPAKWNQQQGFYIYRAGRMIQSGGWSNLRAADEHTKLARVSISFLPAMDEAFKINVAKMRVQVPGQIREQIRLALEPVTKLAREVYDRRPEKGSSHPGNTSGNNSPGASYKIEAGKTTKHELEKISMDEWTRRVLSIATSSEKRIIKSVISRLRKK